MKLYELTVILDSSLDESTQQAEIDKIQNRITGSGGKVVRLDRWGVRRMAYAINNQYSGYYVHFLFESEPGSTTENERQMKINENIIRYLTVASVSEKQAAEKKVAEEEEVEDEAESTLD